MSVEESIPRRAVVATLRPIAGRLLGACALQLLSAIFAAGPVIVVALSLVSLVDGTAMPWSWPVVATGCVVSVVLSAIAGAAALYVSHLADLRFQATTRAVLLDQLVTVPLRWFGQAGTTRIKRAVTDDVDGVHYVLSHALLDAVQAAATPIIYLVAVAWLEPVLLPVAVIPLALTVVANRVLNRRIGSQMPAFVAKNTALDHAATNAVQGNAVLRIFGHHNSATANWDDTATDYGSFVHQWARSLTPGIVIAELLGAPMTAAVVVMAAWLAGLPVSLGAALAVAVIAPAMTAPATVLTFAWKDILAGFAALRRIHTVLAETGQTTDHATGHSPDRTTEQSTDRATPAAAARTALADDGTEPVGLLAENLSASRGGSIILHDISFRLPATGLYTVVGASGSGKTTLLETLSAIIPPDTGQITARGVDLLSCTPTERAQLVTAMWQDVHVLRSSIRHNVSLFAPTAADMAIHAATADAGIAARLDDLPDGMNSVMGEALDLSGGERQRLALARALVPNAPVTLLDEPTSAADAALEDHVMASLRRRADRGLVVATDHRLRLSQLADGVIVLADGKIVEQGTPAELVAQPGSVFANLLATSQGAN